MRQLLSGFTGAAALVAALYFVRFWHRGGERLFGLFGIAFALMALNHLAIGLTDPASELRVFVYSLRLVAFLFIIVAIIDRNRR